MGLLPSSWAQHKLQLYTLCTGWGHGKNTLSAEEETRNSVIIDSFKQLRPPTHTHTMHYHLNLKKENKFYRIVPCFLGLLSQVSSQLAPGVCGTLRSLCCEIIFTPACFLPPNANKHQPKWLCQSPDVPLFTAWTEPETKPLGVGGRVCTLNPTSYLTISITGHWTDMI